MSETKRTGLPYAFVICLCGILSMFCVGAVAGSITAYLPYIIEYGGLTQTQGSSIFTIVCLVSLIVTSVLLEPYYRRFSYRTGLALALAGAAVDYLIYSFSTGYVGFVCGALLGGVVYALAGMVPVSIVINAWFADHTALALGLCAAGTGAASITIPMILSALIERVSLPGVFRVMAVLMAIIAAAVLLLLRDRPQQMGLTAYGTPHSAEQATAPAGRDADRRTMLGMLLGILMLGAVTGGGYQHVSVLYTVAGFSDLQVSRMLSLGGGADDCGQMPVWCHHRPFRHKPHGVSVLCVPYGRLAALLPCRAAEYAASGAVCCVHQLRHGAVHGRLICHCPQHFVRAGLRPRGQEFPELYDDRLHRVQHDSRHHCGCRRQLHSGLLDRDGHHAGIAGAGGSRLYPLQQKSIIEGKWNMQSFTYTITEPVGIHARPAGLLVKEIKNYQSTVTVTKGDKSVNALKLMALMGMGIKCGDTVTVTVEGSDEDTTAPALKQFFETNL